VRVPQHEQVLPGELEIEAPEGPEGLDRSGHAHRRAAGLGRERLDPHDVAREGDVGRDVAQGREARGGEAHLALAQDQPPSELGLERGAADLDLAGDLARDAPQGVRESADPADVRQIEPGREVERRVEED
jgi:hypothetical protein